MYSKMSNCLRKAGGGGSNPITPTNQFYLHPNNQRVFTGALRGTGKGRWLERVPIVGQIAPILIL